MNEPTSTLQRCVCQKIGRQGRVKQLLRVMEPGAEASQHAGLFREATNSA
jgi:hypothetical protein